MSQKTLFYIFCMLVVGGMVSCEDYKDCNSPVQTSLGIRFCQMTGGEEKDSTLPALTMFGIGRQDSLLADSMQTSGIYVPLDQHEDSAGFFLQPDSTMQNGDTLMLKYKRSLQFISSGCGFTTLYHIDTVYFTHHYIDSIAVPTKKIITTNATNLKIYY